MRNVIAEVVLLNIAQQTLNLTLGFMNSANLKKQGSLYFIPEDGQQNDAHVNRTNAAGVAVGNGP